MTEQIKFIVKEINTTLNRHYDLIKFDALDEKQLLQLLVDLLVSFNAGEKVRKHSYLFTAYPLYLSTLSTYCVTLTNVKKSVSV